MDGRIQAAGLAVLRTPPIQRGQSASVADSARRWICGGRDTGRFAVTFCATHACAAKASDTRLLYAWPCTLSCSEELHHSAHRADDSGLNAFAAKATAPRAARTAMLVPLLRRGAGCFPVENRNAPRLGAAACGSRPFGVLARSAQPVPAHRPETLPPHPAAAADRASRNAPARTAFPAAK